MKNIQLYEEFCINEASKSFFKKYGLPEKYKDRAKEYGVSTNPSVLGKVSNFFRSMEDRVNAMASIGSSYQQQRRAARGGGPNTGFETLFGLASVVPNVLKRVFGPTDYEIGKGITSDEQVDPKFVRHVNDVFIKKDLPAIRSERQLGDHIAELYKKAGVRMGNVPTLDDIARNRANLYFEREINPNQPIFQY